MILFLQNYTLKTNQKLSDIIFRENEEQELSQHIHNLLHVELKTEEEEEEDEPISASITDIEEDEDIQDGNNDLNINI